MMKTMNHHERSLAICDLDCIGKIASFVQEEAFVVLLPAYTKGEMEAAIGLAEGIISPNCRELCCVGVLANDMEDALDAVIETRSETNTSTTSFDDEAEALEYFLFAADGARAKRMVAAVSDHAGLREQLIQLVNPDA